MASSVKEDIWKASRLNIVLFFHCTILVHLTVLECSPISPNMQKKEWGIIDTELDEPEFDTGLGNFLFSSKPMLEIEPDHIEKRTKIPPLSSDKLIPDYYKIIVTMKTNHSLPFNQVINTLRMAVANDLKLPFENVRVAKYEVSTGVVELYFVYNLKKQESASEFMLSPASQVIQHLSLKKLQHDMEPTKIISLKVGDEINQKVSSRKEVNMWSIFNNNMWEAWQLAIIISSCLFAIFCIFVVILCLSSRHAKESLTSVEEPRQVVLQPVLKPVVSGVDIIQPENKDCYLAETDSEHTPSPCRSPLRMKAKGLLERRGSNASLTLDLNRSQENIHCGTPPKECSTEEYLLSAGNRMTRKQLRNCLKDVRALHSEFWEIPMNHPEKVEIPGSGTKNRYKTILPNETTRVCLQEVDDDPLSAYINANYIRGYDGEPKAYIATQGPMTHTVNDFWMMVWETKSPLIVMITKLKEKLKVKCEPYVPDHKGRYIDIEVTVLKVLPRDGYTIRELILKKGKETHNVYHFWYTAWPDHKTPHTAKQLLAMALEVEALRHDPSGTPKGPTIVHCSAGIGRTGCFIAVSIGIQQLFQENMVDVLGIVCALRLDRGGMVQTAEQYEFVHQALGVFERTMPDQSGE